MTDTKRPTLEQVQEFHEAFGLPVLDAPTIPKERLEMRLGLLEEEMRELREAAEAGDLTEVYDALLDIQYVLDGTFLEFGMQGLKDIGFAEVHRSNMSKLGEDGKPIYREDGKVLKGPNFFRPDLAALLAKHR